MQNSFEKQVQEKMDELKFAPSAPVWQNIEKQIREKKDRRRFVFWLPLLMLLLGGGTWWIFNGIQKTNAPAGFEQRNSVDEKKSLRTIQTAPKNTIENQKEQEVSQDKAAPNSAGNLSYFEEQPLLASRFPHLKQKKQILPVSTPSEPGEVVPKEEITINNDFLKKQSNSNPGEVTRENRELPQKITTGLDENPDPKVRSVQIDVTDANQGTSDSVSLAIKKKSETTHSKWQFGFVAEGGVAGVSKGLNVFSADKAMLDAYASSAGSFNPAPRAAPSAIRNGLSLGFGVIMKRMLTSRTTFSVGLQYSYYSNCMSVGQLRRQDSFFTPKMSVG